MNKSWKEITKETLQHYYCDQHLSDRQIGDLFGVTRNQVSYKRRYYHITRETEVPTYNEKIIAYLHILGFNHVMEDVSQSRTVHKILGVPFRIIRLNEEYKNIRITFFGSSIVLSIDKRPNENFQKMYGYVSSLIQSYLAYYGILIRGSLCIGHIYQDEQFVFGPAFVKAKYLEQKIARFPRIVIDANDLHTEIRSCRSSHKEKIKERFIYSNDGYYYLDCFYNNKKQNRNIILLRAQKMLATMSSTNQSIEEKIIWMKKELEQ